MNSMKSMNRNLDFKFQNNIDHHINAISHRILKQNEKMKSSKLLHFEYVNLILLFVENLFLPSSESILNFLHVNIKMISYKK